MVCFTFYLLGVIMVLYTFCPNCGKVVDEFEIECGWCKQESLESDIEVENLEKEKKDE